MSDITRREFIRRSIILSMGASYIISCADNEMSTNEELPDTPGGMDGNENHKKIIIIGAGISGLVA